MLEPGRATFEGEYAQVRGAINQPKGIQRPHMPIIVGGNGQRVTFRFAARFADELNLVFLNPEQIAEVLPVIRQRCEEESRDPATLRISIYTRDDDIRHPGEPRVDILGRFATLGLDRIICFPTKWAPDAESQARFAEDCRAAGLPLAEPTAAPA